MHPLIVDRIDPLMPRAILCILDSFGIGGAPDAAAYSDGHGHADTGADTLGHIAANYDLQAAQPGRPRPRRRGKALDRHACRAA